MLLGPQSVLVYLWRAEPARSVIKYPRVETGMPNPLTYVAISYFTSISYGEN
jgi:hypothetical protein